MACYAALGAAVEVECDDRGVATRLHELLAPLGADGAAPDARLVLRGRVLARDGAFLARFEDDDAAVGYLVHAVNRCLLDHTPLLAVHAGGVRWRGHGLLLAGDQGAGKTTLTAALVQDGAAYLTDEAVALVDGRMQPYPKPLSLSVASLAALGVAPGPGDPALDRHVLALALGGQVAASPVEVDAVVLPRYVHGAAPRAIPLGRGEALLRLAKETFHFDRAGRRSLEGLEAATRGARCLELVTGPIVGTREVLLAALGGPR